MKAARTGYVETVHKLLNKGANADLVTDEGETALMIAVHRGHTKIASLIERALGT